LCGRRLDILFSRDETYKLVQGEICKTLLIDLHENQWIVTTFIILLSALLQVFGCHMFLLNNLGFTDISNSSIFYQSMLDMTHFGDRLILIVL
jgi:hypothetical protein